MTDVVSPPAPGLHHVEFVMGMAVSIDLRDAFATHESVIDVVEWLHHVDDTFSTHKTDSAISALGRGELSVEALSEEILEVLSLCESVRTATDGAFDVFEVPAPNGTRFDPSGLVKGWSIERAAALLEAAGCSNFCLNAGGDIAVRGRPEPGGTWKIGIRHPMDDQAIATVVECPESLAVATSASYERGAHIVDPRDGAPTTHLASATVVGPDLTLADAYATAVYVMGTDGLSWIEGCADYDAYVIMWDGTTQWSRGFDRYRSWWHRDVALGIRR